MFFVGGCTWIYGRVTRLEMGSGSAAVSAPTSFSVSSKIVPNRFLTTYVGAVATPTFVVSPVTAGQRVKVYSDSSCSSLIATSGVATSTSVSITLPTISSYGLNTYYFRAEDPSSGALSSCSGSGLSYAYARYFLVNDFVDTNRTDSTPGDGICLNVGGVCSFQAAFDEINALSEKYFFLDVASGTHTMSGDIGLTATDKVVAMYGLGTMPVVDGVSTTRYFGAAAPSTDWSEFHVTNMRFTRLRASATIAALFSSARVYLHQSQVDANADNGQHIFGRNGVLGMGGLYLDESTLQNNTGTGSLVYTFNSFRSYGSTISGNTRLLNLRGDADRFHVDRSFWKRKQLHSGNRRFAPDI